VGLVRALDAHIDRENNRHPCVYAEAAYEIERMRCKHQVGKQDHYAAAYGGLHFYKFKEDETVSAELIRLTPELKYFLEEEVMLFWTGKTRRASPLLEEQVDRLHAGTSIEAAKRLRGLAYDAYLRVKEGNLSPLGAMLNDTWELKKKMTWVSDSWIEDIYNKAIMAGAEGGKITGAGMGGFMIFIAEKERQKAIEEVIGLRRVRFTVDERGSAVVYRGPQ
jgi:D-glycero-alpha-D-manno-heptose-7-phosphate kinase